jgi:hypothetical protein
MRTNVFSVKSKLPSMYRKPSAEDDGVHLPLGVSGIAEFDIDPRASREPLPQGAII